MSAGVAYACPRLTLGHGNAIWGTQEEMGCTRSFWWLRGIQDQHRQ